jgi:hypothetical protein
MRAVTTLLLVAMMGCANTLPPPVVMPEPPREPWTPPAGAAEVTVTRAALPIFAVSAAESSAALSSANTGALVRPMRSWFQGSTLVYPFEEGRVYLVQTKALAPTRLSFAPPERVIKIHPDYDQKDEWFDITLMERESAQQPDYVVVIPKAPLLKTDPKPKKDLLILTTEHAYSLSLESSATQGLVSVRWQHPEPPAPAPKPLLPSGLYYADLEIQPGHGSPLWTPIAAWAIPSLGKTLVQYPPAVKRFGLPIIKAIGADGETKETMNWLIKGDYIEINRFFQVAEVRFGHEDLEKMRAIWCPGSEGCPNLALAQ